MNRGGSVDREFFNHEGAKHTKKDSSTLRGLRAFVVKIALAGSTQSPLRSGIAVIATGARVPLLFAWTFGPR
jgi:hypothetical protein